MQQTTAIQVLPAVSDNATYYVGLQPSTAGRTTALYVSPTLTFVPANNSLTTSGNVTAAGFFYSNGTALSSSGGGGSAISVLDEGSTLTSGVTSFNFVGNGVTATSVGSAVTVTVTAGGGSSSNVFTTLTTNTATFTGTAANSISMIFNSGNVAIDFVLI